MDWQLLCKCSIFQHAPPLLWSMKKFILKKKQKWDADTVDQECLKHGCQPSNLLLVSILCLFNSFCDGFGVFTCYKLQMHLKEYNEIISEYRIKRNHIYANRHQEIFRPLNFFFSHFMLQIFCFANLFKRRNCKCHTDINVTSKMMIAFLKVENMPHDKRSHHVLIK